MTRPSEYHWKFGNGDHIEFVNGGDPAVVTTSSTQISTYEGCAAISDATGQLIAYTDGETLWNRSDVSIATGLGGHNSSTHSSIIVPPAGGGTDYHIFCVSDDGTDLANDPVMHSTFTPGGGTITPVIMPSFDITNTISPAYDNTERLAATSHADCDKYWVISQSMGLGGFNAFRVENDQSPTTIVNSPITAALDQTGDNPGGGGALEQGYMKFSPDGSLFAWVDSRSQKIHVHSFDNSTGMLTYLHSITDIDWLPYGIEFSPDGQYLFYSILNNTASAASINVHTIANGDEIYANTSQIFSGVRIGALQLGPNNKIYGKYGVEARLLEIQNPNAGNAATVNPDTIDSVTGTNMDLNPPSTEPSAGNWGLPTFTRISDMCLTDNCERVLADVNQATTERAETHVNDMPPCDADVDWEPLAERCEPLELPDMSPDVKITWGTDECDCVESDDTEIMTVTVCNPYSNIEYSGFTIYKLTVFDGSGNPVAELPDGSPSVELLPIGPYCFGTIESCSCVSREFVLRNRGAISGEYHIRASGICYNVNLHFDESACFKFNICGD